MSGIWEWWNKILGNKDLLFKNNGLATTPESVKMTGNIILIFAVGSIGLLVATICFVVEAFKVMIRKAWYSVCTLYLSIQICQEVENILLQHSQSLEVTRNSNVTAKKSTTEPQRIEVQVEFSRS